MLSDDWEIYRDKSWHFASKYFPAIGFPGGHRG